MEGLFQNMSPLEAQENFNPELKDQLIDLLFKNWTLGLQRAVKSFQYHKDNQRLHLKLDNCSVLF